MIFFFFFFVSLFAHFHMGSLFFDELPPVIPIIHHPKIQLFLSYICCYTILPPGLPLLLRSCTFMSIILLSTPSSSLLSTWPYHLNLTSCTFLDSSATFTVPLIRVLGILSLLVTPDIHLTTFSSRPHSFFSRSPSWLV